MGVERQFYVHKALTKPVLEYGLQSGVSVSNSARNGEGVRRKPQRLSGHWKNVLQ